MFLYFTLASVHASTLYTRFCTCFYTLHSFLYMFLYITLISVHVSIHYTPFCTCFYTLHSLLCMLKHFVTHCFEFLNLNLAPFRLLYQVFAEQSECRNKQSNR